jgi:hypothetical protein
MLPRLELLPFTVANLFTPKHRFDTRIIELTTFTLTGFAHGVLLAAGLGSARARDSATEGDERAIRSIIAEMMQDWNPHNMTSFISHFTPDSDAVTQKRIWECWTNC